MSVTFLTNEDGLRYIPRQFVTAIMDVTDHTIIVGEVDNDGFIVNVGDTIHYEPTTNSSRINVMTTDGEILTIHEYVTDHSECSFVVLDTYRDIQLQGQYIISLGEGLDSADDVGNTDYLIVGNRNGANKVLFETIKEKVLKEHKEDTNSHVTTTEKQTWNNKSNFSGAYNDLTDRPTIPTKVSQLTNDSNFITKTVGDLVNYYSKSESFTRDEINAKISAIPKFSIQVVTTLPTANISETTVYLLKTGDESQNLYTEYIYVNGKWEYLGKQTVDLTGYATETFVQNYAQPKGNYLTQHQDLSNYAKKATTLSGYGITDGATKEEVSQLSEEIEAQQAQINNLKNPEAPTFVDSVDEMTDTGKSYVNTQTGTIWVHRTATYEKEVTVTDELDDTTYYDNTRLGSSATSLTDGLTSGASGYHVTPLIDLTKYQGKTIQIHLEGARYVSEEIETYIQHRAYKTDGSVVYVRGSSTPKTESGTFSAWANTEVVINSETSATIITAIPLTYGSENIELSYLRFCGKGAMADSNIYITYQDTQKVTEATFVDTRVSYGGSGVDNETLDKISALNNEGESPTTIKLLPQPVLDFYNADAYPDDDYTVTHLGYVTYPCRADIPVPFVVKWNYNENAMRTTVAVDTKAIGTRNAYTMKTYDVTGLNKYPLYNLLPNTTYYYKVTHVMEDGSLVEAKGGSFTTSSESIRLIYIDGTQNVRDLGGWTGLDGKKVKYGKIFRGAALSDSSAFSLNVTGKGKLAFGELKVQAELNLGAVDTETSIAQNCSYKRIGYTNYATAITGETYRAQFKEVLEYIVSCLDGTLTEGGLHTVERNIYFHCQGGCDRTGTLSFQLLGLLGVSESDLAKEYELSSFSEIGYGRLRTTTKAANTYDYVGMVEAIKAYDGTTISDKFYNFAIDCGLSADTITAFRNLMLE